MLDRLLGILVVLSLVLGATFILTPAPASAFGPCEEDIYCHPDLKRPAGGDPCGAWECNSQVEICCIPMDP